MKRRVIAFAGVLCLFLGSCGWMNGSYVSIKPHEEQLTGSQFGRLFAADYQQLRAVLEQMVQAGTENAIINVSGYRQERLERDMESAVQYLKQIYPLGAYAIENVTYEIGSGVAHPAVSVDIAYIHGRSEIRKVKGVRDMTGAGKVITEAMDECSESVVVLIQEYEEIDLVQLAEDYATRNPNLIMELPQVAIGIYPDTGKSRVAEIKFTYQTSRDALRHMQTQVRRIFASASLYVNSDASNVQKCAQLYTFLMERFDYKQETSITPSYSLLNHGVGNCEAFATVYAAMCRQAGLDCQVVSGTRDGESWHWNIICEDDAYYHVDLLRCSEEGGFQRRVAAEMEGYVWDYSAYPYDIVGETQPVETE